MPSLPPFLVGHLKVFATQLNPLETTHSPLWGEANGSAETEVHVMSATIGLAFVFTFLFM